MYSEASTKTRIQQSIHHCPILRDESSCAWFYHPELIADHEAKKKNEW